MSSSTLGIILGVIYAAISITLIIKIKKMYLRIPLALTAVLTIVFSYVSQSNFASFVFLIFFALEAVILACKTNVRVLKVILWVLAAVLVIIPAMMLFTKGVEAVFDFMLQHKTLSLIVGLIILGSFGGGIALDGRKGSTLSDLGKADTPKSTASYSVEGGGLRSFKSRDEAERWAEQNGIDKSKVH